jgi:mannose-6-phosphate isomerase-like protein (cupin superfamily)
MGRIVVAGGEPSRQYTQHFNAFRHGNGQHIEESVNVSGSNGWVDKPWGRYAVIYGGDGYQVKILIVDPGRQLSLQRHHHRREQWVVLVGQASARVGDVTVELEPGDNLAVPMGTLHRLRNPGKVPLEIAESQYGSYLAEDDIERFEDDYGRA